MSAQVREAVEHVEEGDNVPAAASGYTYMTPELQAGLRHTGQMTVTSISPVGLLTSTDSRLRQNVFSKLGVYSPIISN
jgi:hypothetical protein